MSSEPIGYAYLVDKHALSSLPLDQTAAIDSAVKGRRSIVRGDETLLQFEPKFHPADSSRAHLQFALRYEGVNLQVLSLLYAYVGPDLVTAWLTEQPASIYARRAAFLYEWLTGDSIAATAAGKAAFVPLLDDALQFDYKHGARNVKFRIVDNLPGTRDFCPLVRRTAFLARMKSMRLHDRIAETLSRYDPDLLRRAATYLYLKETHSSFEVEREHPSAARAQRFADLLREAENDIALSEDRFIELQNAIVDSRFQEASYRTIQTWVGTDLGYRKRIAFVPPRPEDVNSLMDGLVAYSERQRLAPDAMDPVVAAASLAFGFGYIHPFLDGNGRIHRYLIHEALATGRFTPPGIVLPVSAAILADIKRYEEVLEHFSHPMLQRTEFTPDGLVATGNDAVYFRYFDATEQAHYLYQALERTVERDLQQEIDYLLGFDRARTALNSLLDWPSHSADLFIRVVRQNDGRLSATKKSSHFPWMTEAEVAAAEAAVAEAFSTRTAK